MLGTSIKERLAEVVSFTFEVIARRRAAGVRTTGASGVSARRSACARDFATGRVRSGVGSNDHSLAYRVSETNQAQLDEF